MFIRLINRLSQKPLQLTRYETNGNDTTFETVDPGFAGDEAGWGVGRFDSLRNEGF
jgi:hypothetical protein